MTSLYTRATVCERPDPDPLPDPGPGGPGVPGDERPYCACGAPATWDVGFVDAPEVEYFCTACYLPTGYIGAPIGAPTATAAYAVTFQSRVIEATMRQNRQCPNCQGAHYGWQCPEIARAMRDLSY